MAATAAGGSLFCYGMPAGKSKTAGLIGIRHGPRTNGGHHGGPAGGDEVPSEQPKKSRLWLNPSRDIAAQSPTGLGMDHASVSGLSIPTMSGATTSFIAEPMAVRPSGR